MAGEPVAIEIHGFEWDYSEEGNVAHLAGHDVSRADIDAVLMSLPVFRRSETGSSASHLMIGRDGRNRSLLIYLRATTTYGIWKPVTGWQSQLAHQILEKEGRI